MKKLLLLALSVFALASCNYGERYRPSNGGQYVPPPVDEGGGGGGEEGDDELQATYNFFFSVSTSTHYNEFSGKDEESPIFTIKHAMLKPLEKIPDEVSTVEKVIKLAKDKYGFEVDPTFPDFIGFSYYGFCLDEEGLWNYETDYKQQAVVNLYGIWVSK